MTRTHHIRLAPGPFGGGYDVEVIPPFDDGPCHDGHFHRYQEARGFAGGLRLVLGLRLVDLCEAEHG